MPANAAPRPAEAAPPKRRGRRRALPGSGPGSLALLDYRTREGRLLKHVRGELTAHIGGKPTAVQAALIDRAALLTLHVAMLDAKALGPGGRPGMSGHDQRAYLAFSNSLARALRELGIEPAAAERAPSLADILAGHPSTAPAGLRGSPLAAPSAGAAPSGPGAPAESSRAVSG